MHRKIWIKKHILTHFVTILFQHVNVITATCLQATYLQVDGKNERGGSDDGKGLVIWGRFSILPHGLKEGSVGDEEDDERDEDAMEQADEEVLVIEQQPLLAGQVKLGEFHAQLVIHILWKTKAEEEEGYVKKTKVMQQTTTIKVILGMRGLQ